MKQLTVISGKGGTGKTTITASFAALSKNSVFADCDVDASNLHLLLNPIIQETIRFKGLNLACIDKEKCIECGRCIELCRFKAIKNFEVDPIHCEGCKVCVVNCPMGAIEFNERVCGHAFISETKYGPMSHARLTPGMENSGKLVTLVRQNASTLAEKENKSLILVDGSPGIGCPVIASLANIDTSVIVVEPTLSGIHDLKRALQLLEHFEIEPLVIINKYDLNKKNSEDIAIFCQENKTALVGHIPFDSDVTKAMVNRKTIIEFNPESDTSKTIITAWNNIQSHLGL
jgi:MinD superfamily P-loop ATPase